MLLPCKGSLVRNRGFKRTWIRPSGVRYQKPGDLPNGICAGFIQPGRYNISSGPKRDPKRLSFKARMEPFSGTPPKSCSFFEKLQKFHARPGVDFDENFTKTVHILFAKLQMSTIKSPIAGHLPCGSSLVK